MSKARQNRRKEARQNLQEKVLDTGSLDLRGMEKMIAKSHAEGKPVVIAIHRTATKTQKEDIETGLYELNVYIREFQGSMFDIVAGELEDGGLTVAVGNLKMTWNKHSRRDKPSYMVDELEDLLYGIEPCEDQVFNAYKACHLIGYMFGFNPSPYLLEMVGPDGKPFDTLAV